MQGLDPELVWGLFPRLVGIVYVLAFAGLIPQILGIGGSRGTQPVRIWLDAVRRDYPGPRRFFEFPTVLWLNSSDTFLRVIPWLGVGCGVCAIYGGTIGFIGLLAGWILWLSLEPLGLIFPWETLLQEVGFLVLFVPIAPPLPQIEASVLPLPTVAFMCRWLLLRLMFGFGKDKFLGVKSDDALYLRGFFVWMPLPNPLGWLAHHSPAWFLKFSHVFMFLVEIVAPVLGLFSGGIRLVSYGLLVSLMAGIQATGNWGYFNIAYILLCTCLLDTQSSIFDLGLEPWRSQLWQAPDLAIHVLMLLLFVGSFVYLPLNSWATRPCVQWPANMFPLEGKWRSFAFWVHRLVAPLRWIAPLRLLNAYGVFPPNSSPPMRIIPVFEGSADGLTWKQYGYRHMPSFPHSRPPTIAPYHARMDQWSYYAANGIDRNSLFGSILPFGNPYFAYAHASWAELMAQRLLAGDTLHLRGFGHNPFPDAAPKYVRVGMVAMTPTRLRELQSTGNWWHVQRLGTFVPARERSSWPDAVCIPRPELFHPDFVAWKRRAPALRRVAEAYAGGADADRAVVAGSDLRAQDVEQFWTELVPLLAAERGDFGRLHACADALHARFGVDALYRMERVLERFAWLLRLRTERHFAEASAPGDRLVSNFRYHMMLHEMIIDGRDAYGALLAQPERAIDRAAQGSDATQLWVLALMRYSQFMIHVSSFRWSEIGLRAREQGMPGLFEYYDFLVDLVPRDEQFRPCAVKHDDGEHTIEGFYPPPQLTAGRQ